MEEQSESNDNEGQRVEIFTFKGMLVYFLCMVPYMLIVGISLWNCTSIIEILFIIGIAMGGTFTFMSMRRLMDKYPKLFFVSE